MSAPDPEIRSVPVDLITVQLKRGLAICKPKWDNHNCVLRGSFEDVVDLQAPYPSQMMTVV